MTSTAPAPAPALVQQHDRAVPLVPTPPVNSSGVGENVVALDVFVVVKDHNHLLDAPRRLAPNEHVWIVPRFNARFPKRIRTVRHPPYRPALPMNKVSNQKKATMVTCGESMSPPTLSLVGSGREVFLDMCHVHNPSICLDLSLSPVHVLSVVC